MGTDRVTFSPGEFATLFGKSQSWGYRQIYAGKVKTITEYGRILIPASEVEKILGTAGRYEGMKAKPPKSKEEFQRLGPTLQNAWQSFIEKRRETDLAAAAIKGKGTTVPRHLRVKAGSRKDALNRLRRRS
jgi:hypothetical protein